MDIDVTMVILAETAKDIADDVEVRVGLPNANPWSLPFAHRSLFRERRDDYDLFIYAEDDTLIEQRHVDAFLRLSEALPAAYIPGFMRFEEWPDGRRSMSTVHSYYRWDPSSVFVKDNRTFARFTNDHAACYMLTREHLGRIMDSGGYPMAPHEGEYDMLVSAATDPYTTCGLTKVLCLEEIDDLLIHHLPDVYLGKLGIPEEDFRLEIEAAIKLGRGDLDDAQLIEPQLPAHVVSWSKHTYPQPASPVLSVLRTQPKRILSLGTVSGVTESTLAAAGIAVTAIPVDCIQGELAASRGVDVLPPRVPTEVEIRSLPLVDTILALDVLAYFEDPVAVLRAVKPILRAGGTIVTTVPDHRRYALRNRLMPRSARVLPETWQRDGMHRTDARALRGWLESAGYRITTLDRRHASRREPLGTGGLTSKLTGNTLLAVAADA
ncbi:class I SAM-dependent methyltransferase [Phytoactinopolyspora halotolerans]|uniref:Class I SAM-dependent methyltransferase n=1 Tax=Phytoactinopolyspora halotolerans TaxID=1981512 RepID=A0A6L9S3I5_9ACTN|nr:methyltransferase domain-containing protein [Phytoactinopolyspora halotolerans]NED99612.1 class I SAM-dependent methyltransferase [Phytoactinopolyspora halotolerans]